MSEDAANPPTDDAPEQDGAETAPQDVSAASEGAEGAAPPANFFDPNYWMKAFNPAAPGEEAKGSTDN